MSDYGSDESRALSLSQLSINTDSTDFTMNNMDNTISNSTPLLTKQQCISKICDILKLNDSDESKKLAEKSIKEGRQAIRDHEQDFAPRIFRDEICANQSQLLTLLKQYIEQNWYENTPKWFQQYLDQQKIALPKVYDQILMRTADYGSRFLKRNMLVSLIIQFIFAFDQKSILESSIFDQVWNILIIQGRQGLKNYEDDIARRVMEDQLKSDDSSLYLALQNYYDEPLRDLFQDPEVNIHQPNTIQIALKCVANDGWWNGLHDEKVRDDIIKKVYRKLTEKLTDYLKQNNLPIPAQAPAKNNSSHSNSSLPSSTTTTMSAYSSSQDLNTFDMQTTSNESIEDETRNDERKTILKPINDDKQLTLSDLVQAGELIYIDKTLNEVLDKIISEYASRKNFSSFFHACHTHIMYLLKRHQNLDDFIESLFQKYEQLESSLKLVKLNLRMLIDSLLLNSDSSLSRKLMLLLSKRNSIPFLQPSLTIQSSFRFVCDVIHVWDYLLPIILSFGIGPCSGKSTSLNSIFLSSFEQSTASIYFQNTIDIDFGYNFLPRRSLSIADAHGSMTKILLNKICDLFHGFLVHVKFQYLRKNIDEVREQLNIIKTKGKHRLLIVRDVPKGTNIDQVIQELNTIPEARKHEIMIVQTNSKDNSNAIPSKYTTIQTYFLPDISNQVDRINKNHVASLRDQILDRFSSQFVQDTSSTNQILKNLMDEDYKIQLDDIGTMIKPLTEKLLDTASNSTRVPRYFPEYLQFVQLCELKLKLARYNFYGSESDHDIHIVRQQIFRLEKAAATVDRSMSVIFQLFLNVLKSSDMITCLELLSTKLKEKRQDLVSTSDMAMQLPIEKSLSLEVLWRNAIVCSQSQSLNRQRSLQNKYYQFILAGYPFEIIDGDNFYFQHRFLSEALQSLGNDRTLVISIIGPQNSGKSTLLNYLFGTLFDVRDGRCTRGIYGSLVKSKQPDYDYILLIDTEGLLGVEREDKEYDRRIVLFCLAVSHIVLVNMVGEISSTLQEMLKLCADSLKKMDVTVIPKPIIHFILNQKADLNIENSRATIQKIIADLKREGLDQSIDIRKNTFHTLPSAFKKEGQTLTSNSKLPNLIKTAPEFIECVHQLSAQILNPTDPSLKRTSEISNPLVWLSSSITIFDTLQKFPDLTYYQSINDRRIDNEVREHIRNNLIKIFSADYRDALIVESLQKTDEEIIQLFLTRQTKIQQTARDDMENLFKLLKVPDDLRKRSQQFLSVQIIEMFNALRTSTIAANEREKVKLLVENGEGDLRKLIENTIQSGKHMSADMAEQELERMFSETMKTIQNKYVPEERLKQAMKHIYTNYNIYEKENLFEYSDIIIHLTILTHLNETKAPIHQLEEPLIIHFTKLGYKYPSVSAYPFNPTGTTVYSLDFINSLQFLHKQLLTDAFQDYTCNLSPSIGSNKPKVGHAKSSKNIGSQILNAAKSLIHEKKDDNREAHLTVKSTDEFQYQVRQFIENEKVVTTDESSINDRHMYLGISKIFKEVIQRIMKLMQGAKENDAQKIRTELIQKIVGIVNSLIMEVVTELSPFCLGLSRPLKATLHACAIILLSKYYYDEQMNHFSETLAQLNKKKKGLKEYFISVVVPDTTIDKNHALSLGQQLQEHLTKSYINAGNLIIANDLKKWNCLSRKWVQDRCDDLLLTNNDIAWHLDYISNPTKIIEGFFNKLWKDIEKTIDQDLLTSKSSFISLLSELSYCIEGMLDTIRKLGAPTRLVDEIFLSETDNGLEAHQNLINKQRCMANLVYHYFTEGKTLESYAIEKKVYHVKREAYDEFKFLVQQRKPSPELIQLIKNFGVVFTKIHIVNLVIFLETLSKETEKIFNYVKQYKCDFKSMDHNGIYIRLLDKVRGCPDLCPCCKRPCDFDHTQFQSMPGSSLNEHRCQSGHTLRAMNGYKFETTNEPSLFICEQIKDDQVLVIGPTRYKWSQFKKEHPDWNFDTALSSDEVSTLHGKYLIIWTKVGPTLCQTYGMKYVTHNTLPTVLPNSVPNVVHQSFHYILLLDASGSMSGDPWKHLIEAVQEFVKRRTELPTNDRITIIIFTDSAQIIFYNEEIRKIDLKKLIFVSGGTCFSAAFQCVYESISKLRKEKIPNSLYESFAIIFMSDGESSYPQKELDQLFKDHESVIKRFWTIALGNGRTYNKILEKINIKMNGSFYDVTASVDLIQTYAEVASCTQLAPVTSR